MPDSTPLAAMAGPQARSGKAPGFYGWRVVGLCFVIAAFAWGLGLFGSSVFLHAITLAHGWSVSLVSGAITGFYLVNAVLLGFVGGAIDRWGPRRVLAAGAVALGAGVAGLGLVEMPWHLYLAFAVMGVGWATLSTTGLSATVSPWFERQQGRSFAITLMGASVAGMTAAPLLLLGIGRFGLELTVTVVGLGATAILLPPILLVLRHRGPQALGLLPDGAAAPRHDEGGPPPARAWTRAEAVRTPALWTVAVAFALALVVQVGFLTHHVALAAPALGATGAGLLVSATGFTALLGRLFLAAVADRVHLRRLAAGVMALNALAFAALAAWPSPPVLIAASLAFGFGVGNVTTLSPIIVRREFGAAGFGAIYGAAATVIQTSLAFGPGLFGLLRDAFGGYGPVLGIGSALYALSMLAVLAGRRPTGG